MLYTLKAALDCLDKALTLLWRQPCRRPARCLPPSSDLTEVDHKKLCAPCRAYWHTRMAQDTVAAIVAVREVRPW